jgi:hypothetical protein
MSKKDFYETGFRRKWLLLQVWLAQVTSTQDNASSLVQFAYITIFCTNCNCVWFLLA